MEDNILNKSNTVSAGNYYPLTGLTIDPCDVSGFPFAWQSSKGNYNVDNVSLLKGQKELFFYNPSPISCPPIPFISSYTFFPLSYKVDRGIQPNGSPEHVPMEAVVYINGCRTPYPGTVYQEFHKGTYTIAVGTNGETLYSCIFS